MSRARRGGAKGGHGPGGARRGGTRQGGDAPRSDRARRRDGPLAAILAAAVALTLALPVFSFTYLYDDYDFLGRAQSFRLSQLLPDPHLLFYRPISREIYFGILYALDPNRPMWGHLANAAAWLLSIALFASIAAKVAGNRAGYGGGVALASLGAVPVIVGWTSGCQDLFAILFALAALRAELSGKTWLALLGVAGALLCKETAVALVPAIALSTWILRLPRRRRVASLAGYAIVVAAWAAAHPGVRHLLAARLESDRAGISYLSLSSADRWSSIGKGVATVLNLPVTGKGTPWPSELSPVLLIAAAIALVGFWRVWRAEAPGGAAEDGGASPRAGAWRLAALALLLTVPPLVVVSVLVRQWQPYYFALAALGTSLIAGVALSRLPWIAAATAAIGLLCLGVWCRGMDLGSDVLTERNVRPPMEQVRRVEESLRERVGRIAVGTRVCLSAFTSRDPVVPLHLFRFQALRLWYRDPSIDTLHPEWRRPDPTSERLVWVAPDLGVHDIDLATLAVDHGRGDSTVYEYGATLRAYAQGLAATGSLDRAMRILLTMPASDSLVAAVNRRLAGALALAGGREDEAARITRQTPSVSQENALAAAGEILGNPSRRDIDEPVLASLGLSPADTAATRSMMRAFMLRSQRGATVRFARRLLDLKPGDWEAQALLRWLRQGSEARRVVAPAVSDSLW